MGAQSYVLRVTTTGSAGSATGTADSIPLYGLLMAVHIDYHASAPATTTVDIDELSGGSRKLLDKAASATDVTHYPRVQVQDNTGAAISGAYEPFFLNGIPVRCSVAASDALTDAVIVRITLLQ